jgi:protein gp37
MADTTKIEWTDATWNPITGCTLVDQGCANCYAARLAATRMKSHPSRAGLARMNAQGVAKFTGEVRFNDQWIDQPLRWRKPRMVFVCAHGDLFHERVPDAWIDQVFAVMALAPQHTFQVLTKRPERAAAYLEGLGEPGPLDIFFRDDGRLLGAAETATRNAPDGAVRMPVQPPWPLPNVWLGTSVSDQASADERIPHLLRAPAAVRFVSAEPLLGPVNLCNIHRSQGEYIDALWCEETGDDDPLFGGATLDWIIVGGESGPKARPMHPDWARSLRDQCVAAGTAFFFKQWGEWAPRYDGAGREHPTRVGKKTAGHVLDGQVWQQLPKRQTEGGA